jgi:AcrR family transcriptional regulator
MAQIDSSIPMSFRSVQIESPINQMAAMVQLRGAQEASQMNALKLEQAQREAQERNALAQLDPTSPEYLTQLKRVNPKLALEYQKAGLEAEAAEITRQKNKAELFQARLKESRYFLEMIDPTSPTAARDYLAWHTANHKDAVLGPVLASRGADEASARARIDEAIRTGKLPQLIMQSKLGMEKFIELTPAFNKAEKEEIDQEFSDYLNTPGAPCCCRT